MSNSLSYCDFISHIISRSLKDANKDEYYMLSAVSTPHYDLSPSGAFLSTKKTIDVEDRWGKRYLVTVEEVEENAQ